MSSPNIPLNESTIISATEKNENIKLNEKKIDKQAQLREQLINIHGNNIIFQFKKDIIESIIEYNIFDCTSLKTFLKSITKELHWTGFSGSRFVRCKTPLKDMPQRKVYYTVKIVFYNKTIPEMLTNNPNDKKYMNMTDCEIKILEIFAEEFIQTNITRHIILIFYAKKCNNLLKLAPSDQYCFKSFDSNYAQLYNSIDNEKSVLTTLCNQKISAQKGISYDAISFIALGNINTTLKIYLESYIDNPFNIILFKSFMFMIIYTFFRIKEKYPLFQHNDLHPGNVILEYNDFDFNPQKIKYISYTANDKIFYVPYFGIIPKIIDFGFSSLPEKNIFNYIEIDPRHTPSFPFDNDICFLFHKLYKMLAPQSSFPHIYNLLDNIDVRGTYKIYNREYLRSHPQKITSIRDMLMNNYWDEYSSNTPPPNIILELK